MFAGLTSAIIKGAIAIVRLLPESPFVVLEDMEASEELAGMISMLNWFIPVYSFISILETWLVCVALYYVAQIALRWVKVIE